MSDKKVCTQHKTDWRRLKPDTTIFDIAVDATRGCSMPSVGVDMKKNREEKAAIHDPYGHY